MVIKKYRANTLEEIEEKIRRELGPDAVILTSRSLKTGGLKSLLSSARIEVTVAVDSVDLENFQSMEKDSSSVKNEKRDRERTEKDQNNRYVLPEEKKDIVQMSSVAQRKQKIREKSQKELEIVPCNRSSSKKKAPEIRKQIDNLSDGLVRTFHNEVEESDHGLPPNISEILPSRLSAYSHMDDQKQALSSFPMEKKLSSSSPVFPSVENKVAEGAITHLLISKGVDSSLAKGLEEEVCRHFEGKTFAHPMLEKAEKLNFLKRILASLIRIAPPLTPSEHFPLAMAFIGASGAGKSTLLAKLAIQYHMKAYKRVHIFNSDCSQDTVLGKAYQNRHRLSKEWKIPVFSLPNREELREKIRDFTSEDIIFIDTEGVNQYDREQIRRLQSLLRIFPYLKIFLTISATTKDIDVYGCIQQFSSLSFDAIAFTKIDETISQGVMINASHLTEKPIAYLSLGKEYTEGLYQPDGVQIAHMLLTQNNAQKWKGLRSLVMQS